MIRPPRWARRVLESRERAALLAAIAWLPPALLTLLSGTFPQFLRDFAVHTRCLVAIPVFLLCERGLDARVGDSIRRLEEVLAPEAHARLQLTLRRVAAWRDAYAPEVLTLAIAFAVALAANLDSTIAATTPWWGRRGALEPAAWFYVLVSIPIFTFLLTRWLLRYALWLSVLWRVSRLKWRPVSVHPDKSGGFGIVGDGLAAFAAVVFGFASAAAGTWAGEIKWHALPPSDLLLPMLALLGGMILVFLGPALWFTPGLWWARLRALAQFDGFAHQVLRAFEHKWYDNPNGGHALELGEISSLADLQTSFEETHAFQVVPVSRRNLLQLVFAVLLPMLLPGAMVLPLSELAERLLEAIL